MHYVYILLSSKSKIFYYGSTDNLKRRFKQHNDGLSFSTKPHRNWELVFYAAFKDQKLSNDFEQYLKTGAGKAFAYKRLVDATTLKKK